MSHMHGQGAVVFGIVALLFTGVMIVGQNNAAEEVIPSREYFSSGIVQETGGDTIRTFTWSMDSKKYSLLANLSGDSYSFYRSRERLRDYDLFASDPFDDELIRSLAGSMKEMADATGLQEDELAYLAVSFVQSLPYTADEVTTGFDEYPRFPFETLYDDGGDCEDTSILAVSILQELGFDAALIQFEDHMGVGLACSNTSGYYFSDGTKRYCYLETTGENWDPGKIPDEFKGSAAKVVTVSKKTAADIWFSAGYTHDWHTVDFDINVTVKNIGSLAIDDAKVSVSVEDGMFEYALVQSDVFSLEPEGSMAFRVNMTSSYGDKRRLHIMVLGDDYFEERYSDWIDLG